MHLSMCSSHIFQTDIFCKIRIINHYMKKWPVGMKLLQVNIENTLVMFWYFRCNYIHTFSKVVQVSEYCVLAFASLDQCQQFRFSSIFADTKSRVTVCIRRVNVKMILHHYLNLSVMLTASLRCLLISWYRVSQA